MSEVANSEGLLESEKPVTSCDEVKFPPFPEPTDSDFEDDVPGEERNYYKNKFPDLNVVKSMRLHCTSCDRHLGSSSRNVSRMRAHPMLRTLVCHTCHTFYNSGEFEKGDDGSELYCRWCGQGGQVYCCSNCPHVFCAKCIKRNFGIGKIKEIESTDDWKCFKCSPDCLKDLRALCWATLRYCDLKNEITYKIEDAKLKELYQKDCAQDYTDCCKNKNRRREKESKKRDPEHQTRKSTAASVISKIPPTIQVKKFASMNTEDIGKQEKKTIKRPPSPRNSGLFIKNPIAIASGPRLLNPINLPSPVKKLKVSSAPMINTIKFLNDTRPIATYPRAKQRPVVPSVPIASNFNGFNNPRTFNSVNMVVNDNINLSLENLTQGLDMASMAAISSNDNAQNDVVCTPDFPMEPMCEVTEDNDDDVQCISPDPVVSYKNNNPPPLVPRGTLPDLSSNNIIQMTENDVTVNSATGGLKFRVDPQTLSSNKMYRLPDGRVFAIKANPNMPGGYSATIVAVTDNAKPSTSQGPIYAAKLSAVSKANTSTPINVASRSQNRGVNNKRNNNLPKPKIKQIPDINRECDLSVPVEWYRYNLIDAVDALEYSLSRLNKLKKEATTMFLRTRNINEMRNLHKTLDRLLNTSSKRFNEIRENLNKELKQYISKKKGDHISDDDDVEILPDLDNDDPIFIDENSLDSNMNDNESPKVDLTGTCNSDHNDNEEKRVSSRLEIDPLADDGPSTIVNSSDELQFSLSFISSNRKNNVHQDKIDKDSNAKQNDNNDCIENHNNKHTNYGNVTLTCSDSLDVDGTENQLMDDRPVSNKTEASSDFNQNSNENKDSNDEQDTNKQKETDNVNEDLIEKEFLNHSKSDSDIKIDSDDIKQKSKEKDNSNDLNTQIGEQDNDCNNENVQDAETSSTLIDTLSKETSETDTMSASNCLDIPDL